MHRAPASLAMLGWTKGDRLDKEWLVTNGLGGYASGTVGGTATRRFHGVLIAALPAPHGRTMMLNQLDQRIAGADELELEEVVLEYGLPVWRYAQQGIRIEKRVVMPYGQNTTYIVYRLLEGDDDLTLHLRPAVNFRHHEALGELSRIDEYGVRVEGRDVTIYATRGLPALRLVLFGDDAQFDEDPRTMRSGIYSIERDRGYDHEGPLWSPGEIRIRLAKGRDAGVIASAESRDVMRALTAREMLEADRQRRTKMLAKAGVTDEFEAQLVLAADQFLIRPHTRTADEARIAAAGDTPRTVIAGYHWFTDWGRDTMISLEGLTLATNRQREAGSILRTFASYVRDGLIPNMFPEGEHAGLYHTADATLWFFHAVARYVAATGDRETLRTLIPKMVDIIDHHVRGTRFGIHVDPADGLLVQGADGYQLTWMDAKVDGWVVTPRRGKAVEINALYYNALRILQSFLEEEGDRATARRMSDLADRARESFNRRFWYEEGQHLYDVVDPDDAALRPNQIFAISLDHPVLDERRWKKVVDVVERELLTPLGLRSLSRDHPDYKATYDGDLRARDAAYHQGTVWAWLIGPFVDAWMKVYDDRDAAMRFLDGFRPHLTAACLGTIAEIFDAEPPFRPRGCVAQAWSVAEVLRVARALTAPRSASRPSPDSSRAETLP